MIARVSGPSSSHEIVAVAHTKGGAGKTSLAFNLAYALGQRSVHVVVVDLDQQMGQSAFLGERSSRADIGEVLLGRATVDDALVSEVHPCVDVLPAGEHSMADASVLLRGEGAERLAEVLAKLRERSDVVLLDTPGHQSAIVAASLSVADGVLIPMVPEAGPVTELPTILNTVAAIADGTSSPEVWGVIRMRIWGNSVYRRIAEEQIREISERYEVPLFRHKVPEDAKFGEAHLLGLPVGAYLPSARSAIAYRFIADELIQRRGWRAVDVPIETAH
jgi:chromosome partitioning protein